MLRTLSHAHTANTCPAMTGHKQQTIERTTYVQTSCCSGHQTCSSFEYRIQSWSCGTGGSGQCEAPCKWLGVWSRGGDIQERLKGGVRGDWTYEKGKGWGHWGWKGGGVKCGVERREISRWCSWMIERNHLEMRKSQVKGRGAHEHNTLTNWTTPCPHTTGNCD